MNLVTCARSRVPGRRHVFFWALALVLAALPALNAAEFETVDKLTANGFSLLKSSAEVRGLLGVSTGVPYAALDVVSTGTASNIYAQIWRNGGGVEVASMTSTGVLYATFPPGAGGDHLGNHTATADLNMTAHSVLSVASVTMVGTGLQLGTDLTSSANGLFISTAGQVFTLGLGNGAALPNARGIGAVDLQTKRTTSVQVASGTYAVISGGYANTASGDAAAVAGGWGNTASGLRSFAAGNGNTASGAYASVTGGTDSTASGSHAVIGGGNTNEASGDHSAALGGLWSTASGNYSAVGAGYQNTASGSYSSVLGGNTNTAAGGSSTVFGGEENVAQGFGSLAGGMGYNYAGGDDSIVLSAYSTTTAYGSAIVGGEDHFASGDHSAVVGGYDNTVSGDQAFIGGGDTIDVRGEYSGNVGGRYNIVHGSNSFVGGGSNNQAFGFYTAILGGDFNWAYANESAVVGGNANGAYGEASAILGGVNNRTYGFGSIVLGGDRNHAAGDYSLAAGRTSSSTANGSFTWADSQGGTTVRTINNIADRTLFKNRGGFMITGSTNTYMTGGGDRGVLVTGDGLLGISTGVPYAALDVVSSATASNVYAQIWRDGGGVIVASMTSQGTLFTTAVGKGDNLGNHTATQNLNMVAFGVNTSSAVTAASYQIAGSTVLAILGGDGSIAVGPNSSAFSTGNYNVFVGSGAGHSNTSGRRNTFVGAAAGYSNDNDQINTFIGSESGYSNNAGWGNVFVGDTAGYSNTSGSENTIMGGYMTGYENTSGWGNVFLGNYSGQSNTEGDKNTFIGYGSGEFNVTGEGNVAVGYSAGDANEAGSFNAILGHEAGYSVESSSNTLMGYRSGYNLWTGGRNILLGYQAGYNLESGAGNIVIGYDRNASAENASNELNIGDVLFGKLDDRTIGISTRVPQAALDIVSTGTAANVYAQIWRNGSGVVVASMTSEGKLFADGSGLTGVNAATGGTGGDNLGTHIATQTLNMSGFDIVGVATITVSGYVGISTAVPQAALHVVGGGASYANALIVDTQKADGGTIILGNDSDSGDQVRVGVNGYLRSQAGRFGIDTTGNPLTFEISESEKMRVAASGAVGIGTNNPLAGLEVRSYSDGNYTAVVSTSATAGIYSVAVSSTGITHVNNLVIENRTSDPAAPVTGQIWFRVD